MDSRQKKDTSKYEYCGGCGQNHVPGICPPTAYQLLKNENERLKIRIQELEEALIQHRADLHCGSSRPCPTCKKSAEALGIAGKVPDGCAKAYHDKQALNNGNSHTKEKGGQ